MKMWIKSICFVFVVAVVMAFANQAKAALLPWLDFGTQFTWNGSTLYADGYVTTVKYFDGTSDSVDNSPYTDPILGSEVTMSFSFDDGTSDNLLNVAGWFEAEVISINPSFDPESATPDPLVAVLDNITSIGSGSRWWDEFYDAAMDSANPYGGQLIVSFSTSDYEEEDIYINPEPGTIALLGIGLAGLVGVGVRRRMKKKVD